MLHAQEIQICALTFHLWLPLTQGVGKCLPLLVFDFIPSLGLFYHLRPYTMYFLSSEVGVFSQAHMPCQKSTMTHPTPVKGNTYVDMVHPGDEGSSSVFINTC